MFFFCNSCKINKKFINDRCHFCFLKENIIDVFPKSIQLSFCSHCNSYIFQDINYSKLTTVIKKFSYSFLKPKINYSFKIISLSKTFFDKTNFSLTISINFFLDEINIHSFKITSHIRIKNTSCNTCSKKFGKYYEATLQIRSKNSTILEKIKNFVISKVDSKYKKSLMQNKKNHIFISKIKLKKTELDFNLSSSSFSKHLSKLIRHIYGGELKETFKLIGKNKNGEDLYRITNLIKLPNFFVCDVIYWKEFFYQVLYISKKQCKLYNLETFKEINVNFSLLKNVSIHSSNNIFSAQILSKTKNEISILNPISLKTFEIKVPQNIISKNLKDIPLILLNNFPHYLPLTSLPNNLPL